MFALPTFTVRATISFAVKKHAGGERSERCQRQMQRAERVAAVDKIEDQHKPEDFIGHRNRDVLGKEKEPSRSLTLLCLRYLFSQQGQSIVLA